MAINQAAFGSKLAHTTAEPAIIGRAVGGPVSGGSAVTMSPRGGGQESEIVVQPILVVGEAEAERADRTRLWGRQQLDGRREQRRRAQHYRRTGDARAELVELLHGRVAEDVEGLLGHRHRDRAPGDRAAELVSDRRVLGSGQEDLI